MQASIHQRDSEIQRLSDKVEVGHEADFSDLTVRNETNEAIIISLNQQVRQGSFDHSPKVLCTLIL